MCRNIKRLHNFAPPATEEEIRASALQYVRKISGMNKPSQANQAVFDDTVERLVALTSELLEQLNTTAKPMTREDQAAKAQARGRKREERLRAQVMQQLQAE